ncbi:MAG TPA: hypothetical protein VMW06_09520 [Desulfobacterales bacterium]|nr:hypothetical protein [Desulfobacterales bacterium]
MKAIEWAWVDDSATWREDVTVVCDAVVACYDDIYSDNGPEKIHSGHLPHNGLKGVQAIIVAATRLMNNARFRG